VTAPGVAVRPVRAGGGYAPDFLVLVERRQLDETTRNDVREIGVTLDIKNLGSFSLTFNNWDDQKLRYKYSELPDGPFAVGNRVDVKLGYAGQLVPVIAGTINTLQPTFPESGAPTIAISGTDVLQKLKDRKPRDGEVVLYRSQADWQIAQKVALRNRIDIHVDEEGPVHDLVVQKNQDDATFLMERAKRIDFECFVRTDPDTGQDALQFVKPTDGREARPNSTARFYELAYGPGLAGEPKAVGQSNPLIPNLLSFAPTLTLSNQVSKVRVRGWDPRTKQAITFTANRGHLPPGQGVSGPEAAEKALGDRQEAVIDAPVRSVEEARRLAISLLRERAYGFVTATGRIAGLPELRPGDNVEIHGVGQRFSGVYFVLRVDHTLGASGFFTQFGARRIYDGPKR
jgi:phage protein D